MEVPVPVHLSRKKKTEEETDPDYGPTTGPKAGPSSSSARESRERADDIQAPTPGPSRKKPWEERNKIRRSKKLADEMQEPEIEFIDRPQYSIEDWRDKAGKAREKNDQQEKEGPEKGPKKRMKTRKADAFSADEEENDDCSVKEDDYRQIKQLYREMKAGGLDADNFDLNDLPKYVMGTGKGQPGGPPASGFRSLWNYELDPTPPTATPTEEDDFPWRITDPTVPKIQLNILSVVACFSVGRDLNLSHIANNCHNVEYNPGRCAPLIMRIREPKSTALIYASGKIIVTGSGSKENCRIAARKYARVIQRLGFQVKVLGFRIQNMSAHCNLEFKVRLDHLSKNKLYGNISYEPEMFSGLIIPLASPRVKVTVFCSGSLLMTGAKSAEDLNAAYKAVYGLIKMYGM